MNLIYRYDYEGVVDSKKKTTQKFTFYNIYFSIFVARFPFGLVISNQRKLLENNFLILLKFKLSQNLL